MTMRGIIEEAFGHRAMPSVVVPARSSVTPEQRDAMWFLGRDWRSVRWSDWEAHADAFFAFTPEAFVYYLPSILLATGEAQSPNLVVVHSLLGVLDRSPSVHYWDSFMHKRFVGLNAQEYQVLRTWLTSLSGKDGAFDEDGLMRAYETVDLLESETAKVRGLMRG